MHVTEADDRGVPRAADIDLIEVDFVAEDRSIAGWLRLDVRRTAGATRFLVALLPAGEDPVVVVDHDLPVVSGAFEFRAPGVWTEFCCETPLDHWTIGLEAFGLVVDPAETITPATYGERVPVGLDLDLDTVGAPEGDASSFGMDIRVHGEVLIADRTWDLDGTGRRRRASHDRSRPQEQAIEAALTVGLPNDDGVLVPVRRGWVGGNRPGWVDLPAQSAV
ncbi:MAG: hypothetical protein R8F63_19775 [Acidimicrobiales bacterium]|nr:hypothetical protein [Acidimicrobiales bacterium]